MEFYIRQASEADAASMAALLNPIIRAGTLTILDQPVTVAEQRAFIRGYPERGIFHVAIERGSGEVVGLQDVAPLGGGAAFAHVGEIATFVSLAALRQGIGRALSRATFQAAGAQGFLKLSATIRADNPRAVAFYLSQGFRLIGTAQRHARVGGRFVDEILAEKFLEPAP